jgi:ribosomal 50S subunit-associated protein YjgA (DUF615 family)
MNKTRILPVETEEAEPEFFWAGPSKSQRKRESTALQDMGAELVELSPERLKKIEMPDNLREALRDAQRITQHGAHRRQMQLIGKIMRGVDVEPLQAALDEVKGTSAAATARQHRLERLRERIMADDAVFAESAATFPAPTSSSCASCAAMLKEASRTSRHVPFANCSGSCASWSSRLKKSALAIQRKSRQTTPQSKAACRTVAPSR